MPHDQPTDQRIVTAMTELMRRQGYAGTSIKQLAAASGAPVGSIYHHFPGGKLDAAAAALRASGAVYLQLVPMLLDPHPSLVVGLREAFTAAAEDMETTGWANLCPVGTVLGEVCDAEPALRAAGAEVVSLWVAQGSSYLRGRGLADQDAQSLVHALLAALEGGFVLSRALRSRAPLLAAGEAVASFAATLPVSLGAGSRS